MKNLTLAERENFFRFLNDAQSVESEDQFDFFCAVSLRLIIPFGMMICANGQLIGKKITIGRIRSLGYPKEFIDVIEKSVDLENRKVVQEWLLNRTPQVVTRKSFCEKLSSLEQHEFLALNMENLAAYGVIDPFTKRASYFSFSKVECELDEKFILKLKMVIPYLHTIRCALELNEEDRLIKRNREILSPKELRVLYWIAQGMSNEKIAGIVNRSVPTIKNQVQSILIKLNVKNRTLAVRRALDLGLLDSIEESP
ncbi:response regulator transcription factor [Herbaspirillum seropedicae]|uniref:response regulator transcription factor n=1 Tax=Herbaspirillum seropedicae TaxID=964 RepID=UPI003F8D6D82